MVKLHSGIEAEDDGENEPKEDKKEWMIKAIKAGREKRNVKNWYKILLIFSLQFMVSFMLLYAIYIGPAKDGEFKDDGNDEYVYELLISKFLCCIVLHV